MQMTEIQYGGVNGSYTARQESVISLASLVSKDNKGYFIQIGL